MHDDFYFSEEDYDNEPVRFVATVVRETPKGILLSIDGKEVWMPKSRLTVKPVVVVEIPVWLVEEHDLSYGNLSDLDEDVPL